MIVVNLLGSPSIGKSTMAAGVFARLKREGVSCEIVTEYVKREIWADNLAIFADQISIFAKQHRSQFILRGKVDVAITDSPLLLNCIYGKKLMPPSFIDLVMHTYNQYDNMNFYLNRQHKYVTEGRIHSEFEASLIDKEIENLLNANQLPFEYVNSNIVGEEYITNKVIEYIKQKWLN